MPNCGTSSDFIRSYNHTLSSTFSHPSLPFVHHAQNWSSCTTVIALPATPYSLALSSDESLLAVGAGSDVLVYSTQGDMELAYTLKGHVGRVFNVEWYPNGERKLISGESVDWLYPRQEPAVCFWDLNKMDSPSEVKIGAEYDSLIEAATTRDQSVMKVGPLVNDTLSFPGTLGRFGSSSLSPDGSTVFYLPTGNNGIKNTVAVLSSSTGAERFRLEGHTDSIMWLGSSPDGKLLATSSWDRTVKIWDLQNGTLLRMLSGSKRDNWSGSWSPDGKLVAVGSGDSTVHVWDAFSGEIVHVFGQEKCKFIGWVRGVSFDHLEGRSLVASSFDGILRVFDVGSEKCTNLYQIDPISSPCSQPPDRHPEPGMEISDTLKYAAMSSERFGFKLNDGRVVVYDGGRNEMWEFIQDRQPEDRLYGDRDFIFSRDGRRVYSADQDGFVRVWDLE